MKALAKLTLVEMKLFTREPLTLVMVLAFPLMVLLVMGEVFGNEAITEGRFEGVAFIDYYAAGYIGLVMSAVGLIELPVHLASYREQGILRRLRATSVPLWAVLGSQLAVSFAVISAGAVLIAGLAFAVYGLDPPQSVPGVIAAFAAGTISFAAIGLMLAGWLPTARAAQGAGLLLFFIMLFLAGTGPPREAMSTVMLRISDVLPLTHVVRALQDPWVGLGWNPVALGIVVGVWAAASLLASRAFRWE